MKLKLEELVAAEELRHFDGSELGKAAKALSERLGEHVLAIIGYGSRVYGTHKPDSMMDFLVVVDEHSEFYRDNQWLVETPLVPIVRSAWAQTFINLSGPNFYHVGKDIKVGVMSKRQFQQAPDTPGRYISYRLTKPLAIYVLPGSQLPPGELTGVIAAARLDTLQRTLRIMPKQFTLEGFALGYVGTSYKADIRPEDPTKIQTTYEANKGQLDRMCATFLKEQPQLHGHYVNKTLWHEHVAERLNLTVVSKPAFLFRTFLGIFTAADPFGYALRKVNLGVNSGK